MFGGGRPARIGYRARGHPLMPGLGRLWSLPVLAYGFRPMFLGAGLLALVAIPAWIALRATQATSWGAVPLQLWHAHEMLFGFALAAIAGFLTTAVPNWTGTLAARGAPLFWLLLLWVAARLLLALGPGPTWGVAAAVELAVIPVLLVLIAPPLFRTRNRNRVLVAALAALWVADAVFLWAVGSGRVLPASRALLVTLDLALLMITIIGGRIIPSFTANALRRDGVAAAPSSRAWIERALPALMAINVVLDAVAPGATGAPGSVGTAALAAVIAVLHAARLAGWQGWHTRREPILWSLHLAYAWLPVGFALKALSLGGAWSPATFWLHALGVGAIATMVLAVATRVALGHTGRELRVSRPIAWAYALLSLSAAARVALPHAGALDYDTSLAVAAALWTAAFAVFVASCAPMLLRRRPDGKPG
jgi:uncharacterized protein involved in response to NO